MMKNYHDEDIDIFSDDFLIAKDSYIRMKCTNCGYEEDMPDFVYGEEAEITSHHVFSVLNAMRIHCIERDRIKGTLTLHFNNIYFSSN